MIKRIISRIYRIIFNFTATNFSVREKLVLFETFNGKSPSDNPYAIYEELIKHVNKDNLYWGIKKANLKEARQQYPELNLVSRFSIKWLWIAARANFWVFNSRMPQWLKKNKGTVYIQTWHGTPMKKLGIDIEEVSMPGTSTELYKKNFIFETNRWDYLIAPNQYSKEIFKQAFQFKNKFLEIGYPRNDELVNNKQNDQLQKKLKNQIIGKETGRVILYAPTWRDDYFIKKGSYKFFMPFDLSKALSCLSEEDTLIIRPHYLVGESINITGYEDRVKVCINENINDLYLISDLLITDYSSVMFDFAILKRPMLFYSYDMAHYKERLRGFYFDYSKVPGPIAEDEKSFYDLLAQYSSGEIFSHLIEQVESFAKIYTSWEQGIASKQVVELIEKSYK